MNETLFNGLRVGGAVTVRDKVGRTRYIAFRVEGARPRRHPMSQALPADARLTRFDGTYGIVRTTHTGRDALVELLGRIDRIGGEPATIVTLATSGTIRKVSEALPPGAAPRAPKPRPDKRAASSHADPKAK